MILKEGITVKDVMAHFKQRRDIGPWFEAGRTISPVAAHDRVVEVPARFGRTSPYCIYVHVPFCRTICRFCALYTKAVRSDADRIFDEYVTLVRRHIALHSGTGSLQTPTTVHFGGGTPLHLGLERLNTLTSELRRTFADSNECEWAVETTTSSIDDNTVGTLTELRFQRIHLGVQTLNDSIREQVGLHEPGVQAISKIQRLLVESFFVSVDLIIGFAGTTESVVQHDLELLYGAGVRMFSICVLRNRTGGSRDHKRLLKQEELNYDLWKTIWRFMEEHQLQPIHIGQFARASKDNLYYTHPTRGEDCVAIGPYAHGSFGKLYYGNKLLPEYYRALKAGSSPILAAVEYDDDVQVIRRFESELLAHHVLPWTVDSVAAVYGNRFCRIWDSWVLNRLVVESQARRAYVPSRDGSWFVGNMISEVREMAMSFRSIS